MFTARAHRDDNRRAQAFPFGAKGAQVELPGAPVGEHTYLILHREEDLLRDPLQPVPKCGEVQQAKRINTHDCPLQCRVGQAGDVY